MLGAATLTGYTGFRHLDCESAHVPGKAEDSHTHRHVDLSVKVEDSDRVVTVAKKVVAALNSTDNARFLRQNAVDHCNWNILADCSSITSLLGNNHKDNLCIAAGKKRVHVNVNALHRLHPSDDKIAMVIALELAHFVLADSSYPSLSECVEELNRMVSGERQFAADIMAQEIVKLAGFNPQAASEALLDDELIGNTTWNKLWRPSGMERYCKLAEHRIHDAPH